MLYRCPKMLGPALAVIAAVGCQSGPPTPEIELVITNAQILTLSDSSRATASAMAIGGGRILVVGGNDEVLGLRNRAKNCEVMDLGGKTILPGFIDAHANLAELGRRGEADDLDLEGAADPSEVSDRVKALRDRLPAEAWIVGQDWDHHRWAGDWTGHWPTRESLDAVAPDQPVWLRHADGSAGWANSAALRRAGVGADTADPPGGKILRAEDGQATGVLLGAAMQLVEAKLPALKEDRVQKRVARALDKYREVGVTCVHAVGVDRATWRALTALANQKALAIRVYALADSRDELAEELYRNGPVSAQRGWLGLFGVAFVIDGSLGSRGAALLDPYADAADSKGLRRLSDEQLSDALRKALTAKLQVAVTAVGDAANRGALDVLERLLADRPSWAGQRPRLESVQVLSPEDQGRLGRAGVLATVIPTQATANIAEVVARLGPERLTSAYPYRSLREGGAKLAGGTGSPRGSVNPLVGLHAALARRSADGQPDGGWRPEECLTREQALQLFTTGAAYAGFAEQDLGRLVAGARADFVVLDTDFRNCADDQIPTIQVLRSYVEGRLVYQR